jgi:hypothetical protein
MPLEDTIKSFAEEVAFMVHEEIYYKHQEGLDEESYEDLVGYIKVHKMVAVTNNRSPIVIQNVVTRDREGITQAEIFNEHQLLMDCCRCDAYQAFRKMFYSMLRTEVTPMLTYNNYISWSQDENNLGWGCYSDDE